MDGTVGNRNDGKRHTGSTKTGIDCGNSEYHREKDNEASQLIDWKNRQE